MFRKETEYITPYLTVLIQNSDKLFSNNTFPFSFWVNENSKFNWVDYWQRSTARYLISTTPKECRYRFSTAHWERISLGITLLTIVTIQKNGVYRTREDGNGFIAVCGFVCLFVWGLWLKEKTPVTLEHCTRYIRISVNNKFQIALSILF